MLASFLVVREVDPNTPFPLETATEMANSRAKGKSTKSKKSDKKKKGDDKGKEEPKSIPSPHITLKTSILLRTIKPRVSGVARLLWGIPTIMFNERSSPGTDFGASNPGP